MTIRQLKYVAVRDALKERFKDMPVGTLLPPEAQLCEEYEVSRITLRKAVDYLVEEGLLVREQGRGTFTSEPSVAHKYSESFVDDIAGFYSEMTSHGFEVGTDVLSQRVHPAAAALAEQLGIDAGKPVVSILRLRSVNGAVNCLIESTLPADRFAELAELDLSTGSLYAYLKRERGVRLTRSRVTVEVGAATPDQAEQLHIAAGDPLLVVHSTVFDGGDTPILRGTSWLLPRASQIEFEIHTRPEGNPQ